MNGSTRTPKPDVLWATPCLAYNVLAELAPPCRAELARVQGDLDTSIPGLLRCPHDALHVSLASFLFVRREYEISKELLWARHGERWIAGLGDTVASLVPFELSFTRVSVTDTAVIAVASKRVRQIEVIRASVDSLLAGAGLQGPQPSIVHSTLLRYRTKRMDLARLFSVAGKVGLSGSTAVSSVVISKELVYPSLVTEEVARLHLLSAASPDDHQDDKFGEHKFPHVLPLWCS